VASREGSLPSSGPSSTSPGQATGPGPVFRPINNGPPPKQQNPSASGMPSLGPAIRSSSGHPPLNNNQTPSQPQQPHQRPPNNNNTLVNSQGGGGGRISGGQQFQLGPGGGPPQHGGVGGIPPQRTNSLQQQPIKLGGGFGLSGSLLTSASGSSHAPPHSHHHPVVSPSHPEKPQPQHHNAHRQQNMLNFNNFSMQRKHLSPPSSLSSGPPVDGTMEFWKIWFADITQKNIEQYAEMFTAKSMTLKALETIPQEDLLKFGMKPGDVVKILKKLGRWK